MSEPAPKPALGKGRHGPRSIPDMRYSDVVKKAAEQRFTELAMPSAVAAELGIPYRTAWGWREEWRKAKNEPTRAAARECAVSSDSDPADEQP